MPITILALAPLSLATLMPLVIVLAALLAIFTVYRTDNSVLMTEAEMREACGREALLPEAPARRIVAQTTLCREVVTSACYGFETCYLSVVPPCDLILTS